MIAQHELTESFDYQDVNIGDNDTCGIDGFILTINGHLIKTKDEIEDIIQISKNSEVKFVFIQSKTSPHFDLGEMEKFGLAVQDFLKETPSLSWPANAQEKMELTSKIIEKFPEIKRNPSCVLYYITTGKWVDDITLG